MVTSDLGACEWFVWDLRRSGLIDRGQLDSLVSEFLKLNPRAEAPALAEFLVDQGILTGFQAERVLNSKSQGLVLGPYVLLDAIGSGSMGQVYKASSKNDDILYAVKVLPRRSMWNVRLARRQVRSFAGFTHPAVVPFVDVGTAGGMHYLVWPLVEGSPLEAIVQESGKLPPNLAVLYAVHVAQGLNVSHQNNLFHGLVKPSNIMIGPDNQARLLDFGIGSLLVENEGESLVDTMSTANTLTSGLDCSSPECIMEPSNRTPAGDQYSLGCVLYFCLTGRVPFPEGSAVEKMMAHQTKQPTPVREIAPDVPEGLAAVVAKLMAKTPADRYAGCDEVLEALEPYVGDDHAIPGGVPAAASAMTQSSGRMAGIGSRGNGSAGKMPGLPPKSGASTPAPRFATPPRSNSGGPPRSNPGGPGLSNPGTEAQPPRSNSSRQAGVPGRAAFQLPPLAEELPEMDVMGRSPTAVQGGRASAKSPTWAAAATPARRGEKSAQAPQAEAVPFGWADEGPSSASDTKSNFGTTGLVAVALLLMVAVYVGATMLMKQ